MLARSKVSRAIFSVVRGRPLLPDERRRMVVELLRSRGSVSVAELETRFGISLMTVRRDLAELERIGLVRRTHGGAVLPAMSGHEDSFATRLEADVAAKERLAEVSAALLPAGASVYVDSSTTSYIAVRRLLREKLRCTLLTNSLPVMDLVCRSDTPEVELVGVGGALRTLTRSYVGPQSVHCVRAHFADYAIFSVRGVTDGGYLTDPDPLEAEVKRVMIGRARHPVLLLDASKLGRAALSVVAELSDVRTIIGTDIDDGALARLAGPRVDVRVA